MKHIFRVVPREQRTLLAAGLGAPWRGCPWPQKRVSLWLFPASISRKTHVATATRDPPTTAASAGPGQPSLNACLDLERAQNPAATSQRMLAWSRVGPRTLLRAAAGVRQGERPRRRPAERLSGVRGATEPGLALLCRPAPGTSFERSTQLHIRQIWATQVPVHIRQSRSHIRKDVL